MTFQNQAQLTTYVISDDEAESPPKKKDGQKPIAKVTLADLDLFNSLAEHRDQIVFAEWVTVPLEGEANGDVRTTARGGRVVLPVIPADVIEA